MIHYKVNVFFDILKIYLGVFQMNSNQFIPGYQSVCYLDCGKPYLTPTPTRGKALMTRLTVAWSGKENITAAGKEMDLM